MEASRHFHGVVACSGISLFAQDGQFMHRLQKEDVKYEQDQKRFNILWNRSGKVGRYILEEESLKKLSEIIAKQQLQEESVNEKVDCKMKWRSSSLASRVSTKSWRNCLKNVWRSLNCLTADSISNTLRWWAENINLRFVWIRNRHVSLWNLSD